MAQIPASPGPVIKYPRVFIECFRLWVPKSAVGLESQIKVTRNVQQIRAHRSKRAFDSAILDALRGTFPNKCANKGMEECVHTRLERYSVDVNFPHTDAWGRRPTRYFTTRARQPYLDCVGEGVDCITTGIWGLLGCDLYTRKPKIPHTNGAKKRGNSSVINCSNAKSESPINPKIYPTTLVAENSFLVFDITRSMRNKLAKGAYNAVFFDKKARRRRDWLPVQRIAWDGLVAKPRIRFQSLSISSLRILRAPRRF